MYSLVACGVPVSDGSLRKLVCAVIGAAGRTRWRSGGGIATWGRGLSNDVYFQVGLLTVVGLTTKNAILIVEFAKAAVEKGQELISATLHASRVRLRPIVMTSLAFGLGVMPAGAGQRARLGQSACRWRRGRWRHGLRNHPRRILRAADVCDGDAVVSEPESRFVDRSRLKRVARLLLFNMQSGCTSASHSACTMLKECLLSGASISPTRRSALGL